MHKNTKKTGDNQYPAFRRLIPSSLFPRQKSVNTKKALSQAPLSKK